MSEEKKENLQVTEFKTGVRGDPANQFAYYDDIFAASTDEDRAKVRSWFGLDTAKPGADCTVWSHGSLTAQLGERLSPMEGQSVELAQIWLRENLQKAWNETLKTHTGRMISVVPMFDDVNIEQKLEQAIAEIAFLTRANKRLTSAIAEGKTKFEERLSSSWEHLPCVTTGLRIPIPPTEQTLFRALRTGQPR